MIARSLSIALSLSLLVLGAVGCANETTGGSEDDVTSRDDALAPAAFVRSDQVSFGRAPHNTGDLSKLVHEDFGYPLADAGKVISWLKEHPDYENPVYLGNIHTWIYDTDHEYRVHIHTLASQIQHATHHPILFYFEEENASHSPHAVSKEHGAALRTLAKEATLLCATYVNGQQSHAEVVDTIARWKNWYHGQLGIPMDAMMIDVDLSQTPVGFYYGSRGDLPEFDHVVGWALRSAFNHGFAGFHTYGNVGGHYGTLRAADSTYATLKDAWHALVEAHPHTQFTGL